MLILQVRSYLHVRDVARAFDTVLHKGVIGQVYNIGTQKERSVLDVVTTIAKHLKVDSGKIKHVEDRAFNDQRCAPHLWWCIYGKGILLSQYMRSVAQAAVKTQCASSLSTLARQ